MESRPMNREQAVCVILINEYLFDSPCQRPWRKSVYIVKTVPRWLSGKEPTCQWRSHRRCRFNAQVGKITWRRKWQPTIVFLPEKSHGQKSLVGYSACSHKELDMTGVIECGHEHRWSQEVLDSPFGRRPKLLRNSGPQEVLQLE